MQENKDVISRVIPLMKVAGLSIDTPNALQQVSFITIEIVSLAFPLIHESSHSFTFYFLIKTNFLTLAGSSFYQIRLGREPSKSYLLKCASC